MNLPVILFVYRRPDLTRAALDRLALLAPKTVLVVADGPASDVDTTLCREVRDLIRKGISWEVDDLVLEFSDEHLGCQRRFESGLDWAFQRVDRALILEDDIEISAEFAAFAEDALGHFERDARVRMVTARNVLVDYPEDGSAPFLARKGSIWGWATWADRWKAYREGFRETTPAALGEAIENELGDTVFGRLQGHLLHQRLWEKIDTWDMTWSLWNIATGGRCLTPPRNLSVNHGMRMDATHTQSDEDVRGRYPLRRWGARAAQWNLADTDTDRSGDGYDDAFTLLELMLNWDKPRRWQLLARQRSIKRLDGEGWQIMLAPFDHPRDSRRLLEGLVERIGPTTQLADLLEVIGRPR